MPWNVTSVKEPMRLELTLTGRVTPGELRQAAQECMHRATSDQVWLVLADCLQMEGGHSIFDLHALADFLHATGLAHRIREAVVAPEQGPFQDVVKFWETTCFNRGIQVRLFSGRNAALAWLSSSANPADGGCSKCA